MPLPHNPYLREVPVYVPGRPIEETARELGLDPAQIIKLASNENPLGPSPAALRAVRDFLPQSHLYPDGNAFYLKQKLAQRLRTAPENLILGNGSNEILEFAAHAFIHPEARVIVSQYSFAVYPIVTQLFGGSLVSIAARDFGHDLPAMAAAITPDTRVVFVANPNNPTGTLASARQVLDFIHAVPAATLVVMDEAYIEFVDDPADLLPLIRAGSQPNLLLCRTFSKIYGLAGFRIGYGIGHAELIGLLEKSRQPFNINALAQAAALAALDDTEHLDRTRGLNRAGLRFFESEFRKRQIEFVPSAANFIMVRVGQGQACFADLQRAGIIVRPMASYQLPEWIRITIGTEAQNQRCIETLSQYLIHP